MDTVKLNVTAEQLNNIPITVKSAQISDQCVYVGSLRNTAGFHSSRMTLYISLYAHISTVHIDILQLNTTYTLRVTKDYINNQNTIDKTKVLVTLGLHNTWDIYVTGSYSSYYTAGTINITGDPTIEYVRPIGDLVNVSDILVQQEYLIKDISWSKQMLYMTDANECTINDQIYLLPDDAINKPGIYGGIIKVENNNAWIFQTFYCVTNEVWVRTKDNWRELAWSNWKELTNA